MDRAALSLAAAGVAPVRDGPVTLTAQAAVTFGEIAEIASDLIGREPRTVRDLLAERAAA